MEALTRSALLPLLGSGEFIGALTRHALHYFGSIGLESEGSSKNDANTFFSAVCKSNSVADALSIKKNICFCFDGYVFNYFLSHDEIFVKLIGFL